MLLRLNFFIVLFVVLTIITETSIALKVFSSHKNSARSHTQRDVVPIFILPVLPAITSQMLPWLVPTAALLIPPVLNISLWVVDKYLENKMIENLEISPDRVDSIASRYAQEEGNNANLLWTDTQGKSIRGRPVIAARFVTWILRKVIEARTQFISGLEITVLSESNRHVFMGKVSELEMIFDKISIGSIVVSGGGKVVIEGLDLRMRRFLFGNLQSMRQSYQIFGDFLLTQSDIVNSKVIRNLLQMLVDLIFKLNVVIAIFKPFVQVEETAGMKATVKRVSIRSRRLFCNGEVALDQGSLPFELSAGLGLRENGHVVFLKDIEITINPDNLLLRTSVVLPLSSAIDVDIGDDCQLANLVIANKHVWLRARSRISPVVPFAVTPVTKRALFRYDLGALMSSILRVRGGIIRFENKLFDCFNSMFNWFRDKLVLLTKFVLLG